MSSGAVSPAAAEGSVGAPLGADGPLVDPSDGDQFKRRRSLDRSFVHAVAWTGGVKWAVQLISWPITIWTAKLLVPSDYGFLAVIGILTRFMSLLTEAGVGTAIVAGAELSDSQMKQLNALSCLGGAGSIALSFALAWPVALIAHDWNAGWVLVAFSGMIFLDAAMIVPNAAMRRAFRYRDLVLLEALRNLTTLVLMLVLAYHHMGYWALVIGQVCGPVVQGAATFAVSWVGLERPRKRDLGPTLRFSAALLIRNIGEFLSSNSDRLIGAKLLGDAALGGYTFAGILAFTPSEKISSMVARVVPALFGRIRDDHAEMVRYMLRITEALSFVTLPAFVGLALIADQLVKVMLGPQWVGAIGPLRAFCIYAAVLDCLLVVPQALVASDNVRPLAQNAIVAVVLYPPLFLILGYTLGIDGLAVTWVVVGSILSLRLLWVAHRKLALSLRAYARCLVPAMTGCAVMSVCVLAGKPALASVHMPAAVRLAVLVLAGAAAYVVAALIFHRRRTQAIVTFVLQQRRAAAA